MAKHQQAMAVGDVGEDFVFQDGHQFLSRMYRLAIQVVSPGLYSKTSFL